MAHERILTDVGVAECSAGGAAGVRASVAVDPIADRRTACVAVSVLTLYSHIQLVHNVS